MYIIHCAIHYTIYTVHCFIQVTVRVGRIKCLYWNTVCTPVPLIQLLSIQRPRVISVISIAAYHYLLLTAVDINFIRILMVLPNT